MNNELTDYVLDMATKVLYEADIFDGFVRLVEYHPKKYELLEMFVSAIRDEVKKDQEYNIHEGWRRIGT